MTLTANILSQLLLSAIVHARDITFPPQVPLAHHGSSYDADILTPGFPATSSRFVGLSTYANLPYVYCLAEDADEVEKFDVAFVGAGFDTVRLSLRLVFRSLENFCPWSRWAEVNARGDNDSMSSGT
jgi:hypothetical protein